MLSLCSTEVIFCGRYLTSSGIEKQSRTSKKLMDGSSKPKQKQKGKPSALQPEIVEAALRHEVQEEAVHSLEKQTASAVPVHTPKVVSAFSEASRSQVITIPTKEFCSLHIKLKFSAGRLARQGTGSAKSWRSFWKDPCIW